MNAERKPCVFFFAGRKGAVPLPWRDALCARLPPRIAKLLRALDDADAARLTELRFHRDRPVELVFADVSQEVPPVMDAKEMDALLAALSGYALYACESQMAEGYIPLGNGHRAGVCGRLVQGESGARMSGVSSVCVRVARHVPGASLALRPHLLDARGKPRRALILGAPGSGKTTALRDAAVYLSDECGLHVAVADEREELFGGCIPPKLARRVDVLAGADKAAAVRMLLRAMAPEVIVTDELGKPEDVDALLDTARCGVGLIASAHAGGMEDALRRPALRALIDARAFDRYLHIGVYASLLGAWDESGREVGRWSHGTSP